MQETILSSIIIITTAFCIILVGVLLLVNKYHRSIEAKIHLSVNGSIIESSKSMSVLGVIFDSKLNWNDHIAKAINKANSALHCIRLIKYYFTPEELTQIITSNFYSILYY